MGALAEGKWPGGGPSSTLSSMQVASLTCTVVDTISFCVWRAVCAAVTPDGARSVAAGRKAALSKAQHSTASCSRCVLVTRLSEIQTAVIAEYTGRICNVRMKHSAHGGDASVQLGATMMPEPESQLKKHHRTYTSRARTSES